MQHDSSSVLAVATNRPTLHNALCVTQTTGKIELVFLARRFPSTHPTLCRNKIRVSPKIRTLSSGTLSRTRDEENFATASRSRCQQDSSTAELADDILRRGCLLHVGRYFDLLWICGSTCSDSCGRDFNRSSASRGPSAAAEPQLLVCLCRQS